MKSVVTVKFIPTTEDGSIEKFNESALWLKDHLATQHEKGVFGRPENVEMRYVIEGGRNE